MSQSRSVVKKSLSFIVMLVTLILSGSSMAEDPHQEGMGGGTISGRVIIKDLSGKESPFSGNVILDIMQTGKTVLLLPKAVQPDGSFQFSSIDQSPFSYRLHAIYENEHFVSKELLYEGENLTGIDLVVGPAAPAASKVPMPEQVSEAVTGSSSPVGMPPKPSRELQWLRERWIAFAYALAVIIIAAVVYYRNKPAVEMRFRRLQIVEEWKKLEDSYHKRQISSSEYHSTRERIIKRLHESDES